MTSSWFFLSTPLKGGHEEESGLVVMGKKRGPVVLQDTLSKLPFPASIGMYSHVLDTLGLPNMKVAISNAKSMNAGVS